MDIWTPISAHAEWVGRFRETLYGGTPNAARMVADDKVCKLGQWFEHHDEALGHLREYQAAKDIHGKFHVRASYCLRLADAGRRSDAFAETGDKGELRRLSRLLVQAFQELKRLVAQQGLVVTWNIPSRRAGLPRRRGGD